MKAGRAVATPLLPRCGPGPVGMVTHRPPRCPEVAVVGSPPSSNPLGSDTSLPRSDPRAFTRTGMRATGNGDTVPQSDSRKRHRRPPPTLVSPARTDSTSPCGCRADTRSGLPVRDLPAESHQWRPLSSRSGGDSRPPLLCDAACSSRPTRSAALTPVTLGHDRPGARSRVRGAGARTPRPTDHTAIRRM